MGLLRYSQLLLLQTLLGIGRPISQLVYMEVHLHVEANDHVRCELSRVTQHSRALKTLGLQDNSPAKSATEEQDAQSAETAIPQTEALQPEVVASEPAAQAADVAPAAPGAAASTAGAATAAGVSTFRPEHAGNTQHAGNLQLAGNLRAIASLQPSDSLQCSDSLQQADGVQHAGSLQHVKSAGRKAAAGGAKAAGILFQPANQHAMPALGDLSPRPGRVRAASRHQR